MLRRNKESPNKAGLSHNLSEKGHHIIDQNQQTECNSVFPENSEVVFFDIVGQEADSKDADSESHNHGHQKDSDLLKAQGIAVNDKLEDLEEAGSEHDRNP